MTIYLDIIFLENLFMNYIILFATAVILKADIKIIRTFLSSIIGSIYAIITYLSVLEVYSNIILKIILSVVMVQIAFNTIKIKALLKCLMIFYLTSFTFGGVAFALLYFIDAENISLENGVLTGLYPIKIIFAGGILGFLIITTAFKNMKGKLSKKDIICNIRVDICNRQIWMRAVIDTGNFLREPITGNPVIIVEANKLKGVLPDIILKNLKNIIDGKEINLGEYASKVRMIPFSSLGKQNGILVGIKINGLKVETEEEIYLKNVVMGLYEGILNKNSSYSALIGLDILDNKGGIEKNEYYGSIKS